MPTPLPSTIQQVIHRLDEIIEETKQDNNRLGIFAYVYRRTTAEIQKAIQKKRFEDNERMEKMDVVFANRYIEAYQDFKLQKDISKSWLSVFEIRNQPLTIIQHIMMGMNTHISFDLGIATETTAPGDQIDTIKNDFVLVNQILKEITEEMQKRVGRVSRFLFLLDWICAKKDKEIINFGIVKARDFAWKFAQGLSATEGEPKDFLIKKTDGVVAKLNHVIQNPPGRLLQLGLKIISFFEEKNVERIIERIRKN